MGTQVSVEGKNKTAPKNAVAVSWKTRGEVCPYTVLLRGPAASLFAYLDAQSTSNPFLA